MKTRELKPGMVVTNKEWDPSATALIVERQGQIFVKLLFWPYFPLSKPQALCKSNNSWILKSDES